MLVFEQYLLLREMKEINNNNIETYFVTEANNKLEKWLMVSAGV